MTAPARGDAAGVDGLLAGAREAAARGDIQQATRLCRQVLELAPDQAEALKFVGERTLAEGQFAQAKQLLERAVEHDGGDTQLLKKLGLACMGAQRFDEARFAFDRALTLDPDFFVARLYLGCVLESLGHGDAALKEYYSAILKAQSRGSWLGPDTTPPPLRDLVTTAMRFVDAGRGKVLSESLAPLHEQHGDEALRRVDHALDRFLGKAPANGPEPPQKPRFLYFPGLPATRWFAGDLFDWYELLQSNTAVIREELLGVLHERSAEPAAGFSAPGGSTDAVPPPAAGTAERPAWDAFHFYQRGVRNERNCALCPRTAAILDALPLVRIRAHAPEIAFSALAPGARVGPYCGATNARLLTHLPLIVPADCAMRVGGEEHVWREGRCITFDSTFEHEAWNRSGRTQLVLALDTWNPHLTGVECDALARLVEAVGAFDREYGVSG